MDLVCLCPTIEEDVWSKAGIPDYILEYILGMLPIRSIFIAKAVCRRWKAAISTKTFLKSLQQLPPLYVIPWWDNSSWDLDSYSGSLAAYDPHTDRWHSFHIPPPPPSIILEDVGIAPFVESCFGGLLCFFENGLVSICNPMTKAWRQLPLSPWHGDPFRNSASIAMYDHLLVLGQLVHRNRDLIATIDVYDSKAGGWRHVGSETLHQQNGMFIHGRCCICNGIFYFYIKGESKTYLVSCNLSNNAITRINAPLPPLYLPCITLLSCMERVVMVGRVIIGTEIRGIEMWELQVDGMAKWEKIARMPDDICKRFSNFTVRASSTTSGELIFLSARSLLVVFNIRKQTWHWAPDPPVPRKPKIFVFRCYCFNPTLQESRSWGI